MVALGAEIIRTPTEAAWDDEESHISLAKDLEAASGGKAHVLDQYRNSGNPLAHYEGTADELLEQCGNNLDVVVLAAGTGGTVTGVGKRVKEALPHCKVVAVDPVGSLLAVPEGLNARKRLQPYQVEGIGYDFLPTVLDRTVIDAWVKVDDREAFGMARACVKHEGLLVGGSSGSALAGAFAYIQDQGQALHGKRVAVLCADGVRNYMSKFLDDAWMNEHEFPLDVDFKHGTLSTSGEFTANKQTNEEKGGEQSHETMEWTSMSPSEMLKAQALAFRMKELDAALSSSSISDSEYANQKAKLEKRLKSSSSGINTK